MDGLNTGQVIFVGANFLAWTITYVLIAVTSYRSKRAGIPLEAISVMLAFEIAYVFVFGIHDGPDPVTGSARIAEIVWLILDVILFVQVVVWGAKDASPELRAKWKSHCAMVFALALFGVITFVALFDLEQSGIFAFIDEAAVAVWFVPYVIRRAKLEGISYWALWSRTGADVCATVALLVFTPWCDIFAANATGRCVIDISLSANWFVVFLAITWFTADAIALGYATKKRQQARSGGTP
jgi:hypothetical protein